MNFTRDQLAAEAVAVLRRDGKTQLADAVHDTLVAAIDQRGALTQIIELADIDKLADPDLVYVIEDIERVAKQAMS